ncbi:MAG: hypothetical protein RLZZ272_1760, partial [Actinomycetota bacterium]
DELAAVLDGLVRCLAGDAEVVVERASASPAPRWPAGLVASVPRRYGSSTLHRARRSAPAAEPAPAADPELDHPPGPAEQTEPT